MIQPKLAQYAKSGPGRSRVSSRIVTEKVYLVVEARRVFVVDEPAEPQPPGD
jgi:hypothetical protein